MHYDIYVGASMFWIIITNTEPLSVRATFASFRYDMLISSSIDLQYFEKEKRAFSLKKRSLSSLNIHTHMMSWRGVRVGTSTAICLSCDAEYENIYCLLLYFVT